MKPAKGRSLKNMCKCCGQRRALFLLRRRAGRVIKKQDRNHDLCGACYRAHLDSLRVAHLEPAA